MLSLTRASQELKQLETPPWNVRIILIARWQSTSKSKLWTKKSKVFQIELNIDAREEQLHDRKKKEEELENCFSDSIGSTDIILT